MAVSIFVHYRICTATTMTKSLIETPSLLISDRGTFSPAWQEEAVPFWKENLTLTYVYIFNRFPGKFLSLFFSDAVNSTCILLEYLSWAEITPSIAAEVCFRYYSFEDI